jgi:iron-sulfur cluster assembly protein
MFDQFQPISISATAAKQIHRIMKTKGIPEGYGLRVGVKGGGCGVSMMIGFDKRKSTDLSYFIEGIEVLIDKKHTMYITGKQVDYIEGQEGVGFTFITPV